MKEGRHRPGRRGAPRAGAEGSPAADAAARPASRALPVVLATAAALFAACPGKALANANERAKLIVHLGPPSAKAECAALETTPPFQPVTAGGLYPPHTYFAYVMVMGGSCIEGIGGVEFGIDYDGEPDSGVEIYDWTFCGGIQYPSDDWPAPGGGNQVAWDWMRDRRLRGRAVIGYFYLGAVSPDRLSIAASPGKRTALVADTQGVVDEIPVADGTSVGAADFGGGSGVDPTRAVPSYEASTWRAIARLYREKGPTGPFAGAKSR